MTIGNDLAPEQCLHCSEYIEPHHFADKAVTVVKQRNSGERVRFHTVCWALFDANQREAEERRAAYEHRQREVRAGYVRRRFEQWNHQTGKIPAADRFPRWEWARFDNAEFKSRVVKRGGEKILNTAEEWSPDKGSILCSAPTGRGKTSSWVAWLWRMQDEAIARVMAGEPERYCPWCWATGHDLVKARKQHGLGDGEATLVELALEAYVLVLDELGFEPGVGDKGDPIIFEIINARYAAERRTIVTTGLSVADFKLRYGVATFRRLIEPGAFVEIS
jgi:ribosomal protein L32